MFMSNGSSNALEATPLPVKVRYQFYAYSCSERISLRKTRRKFPEATFEQFNERCVLWNRGEDQLIFVFRFGTVVFFNVPPYFQEEFLNRLEFNPVVNKDEDEEDEEDDLIKEILTVTVEPSVLKVEFNSITIPDLKPATVQIVAEMLARSNSLEVVEWEVDEMMKQAEGMAVQLKEQRLTSKKFKELLRVLGESLSTRYRLVNQLAVLDDPEKTWEEEQLYTLYTKLYENLDLEDRLDRIEKLLDLASESCNLMVDLYQARRSHTLEMIIIILIVFEIVMAFFG